MSDSNQSFKPFIPANENPPEMTVTSVVIGVLMAILFGAANAYLGLRVGMTISASIPAAVISMGVIRIIMRKDSILENNMVQTIGSAGESVAAGAIFTLPAIFLWAKEGITTAPSLVTIAVIAAIGGSLGIFFMIPLRAALIVKEHGKLPYPEGTACADVLEAGETGGAKAVTVFSGMGIAAVYKFIADGFQLFPSEVTWDFDGYKGSGFGADVLPALLGVGYICGPKVTSYMMAGGVLAWFVIMPLIALFGASVASPIYPASTTIAEMSPVAIWSNYVKYIGAGAVAAGGIISLIKSLPLIVTTFRDAMKEIGVKVGVVNRQNKDINMKAVVGGIIVLAILLVIVPVIPLNPVGAIIVILFGFFFATVSSRMVGLIGSSNNPVSGMTIASLLLATSVLRATGNIGPNGMIAAITIGSIICISTAIAGDISQDLKTGYIVGATPYRQQIGEFIGVFASAFAVGGVLYLLNSAWGYGGKELPAPQATLMKLVVEGVMNGNLPWALVFAGVFIAIVVEIIGIPVLAFAVGLYLPIYLSAPMMVGGLVRLYFDKKKMDESERKDKIENGLLYSSGLIAGEGVVGILLALLAVFRVDLNISKTISLGNIGGVIFYALLTWTLVLFINRKKKSSIR